MDNMLKTKRKIKEGKVVSNKMQKTVTVRVERTLRHPHFDKVITRAKRYYAHHDLPEIPVGKQVKIIETRPLSKLKCWKVIEVID
ncbi:MAG: 30S ribosomal protein S17 [Chlamydiae bacterium GWC2_50_10]|uniref:Small ribosomal subunit protein uS17 n=1 Tax=uncultured Chlamydiae bacterium Rifle_16ft_4_minimus_1822 TaxID=1665093 RepID=A0A0H4T1D7_9BACT|nr:30S ribosomal protein S17, small subunit ribosomal protein S17 [uncultured Chlamydiae bacterium Rifle_16ft_4_minimus_1822]OGN52653.1 MAG: 30S ribosomal protein S17 [Chlamydiae bacterium GWA2_50_15]OGN54073.1 MAG: 30S ribosomal protein S17 [Chlamydiae bacterium GWF2_49_8]OGN54504.1 MAG: 30S ribosomal protein S17 [Chlamydiae bacterium GWC2_50_10]OGN57902.1 MAG: 30S ribosomal protein S17 [Chlamydiae bacterium RIFCSPHIGHO2_02_FULL_49_29]OGN63525.1 MAG: 30S ribosomal protein S17 [Chlamydiae bact